MPLAGLTLPQLSAFDPPVAGEGSLDPLGLAAFADRLANAIVPDVRARMGHIRFVTATAVGALAWESLIDEPPGDGVSTPSICFEWILLEALFRRRSAEVPLGIPGSQKARLVIASNGRLDARNYLKSPNVFGFVGVHKPLSVGMHVVDAELRPAERCLDLAAAWAADKGMPGYVDEIPATAGGSLRARLREAIRNSLRVGACAVPAMSHLLGELANTMMPSDMGSNERRVLRSWLRDPAVPLRDEAARLLEGLEPNGGDEALLEAILPLASADLRPHLQAIEAYEALSRALDLAFNQIRYLSTSHGATAVTLATLGADAILARCAHELPRLYQEASEALAVVGREGELETTLGAFGPSLAAAEMATTLFAHHDAIQKAKPPRGKRPWFEEYGDGWVVRQNYRQLVPPEPATFLHPVRLVTLCGFMRATTP